MTLGGIAVCMAVSVVFNLWLFWTSGPDAFFRSMLGAIVLPVLLAGPLFVVISLKLRQAAILNRELQHTASHDGLTSILNRSAFTRIVHGKLDEIDNAEGGRGALLLVDADFFKAINDRWGHPVGDETLRRIARLLVEVTRAGDVVGRLGGEEFGIFLPGAGLLSAEATAERLRAVVAETDIVTPTGEAILVTVSVGGVFFRNAITYEMLFHRADRKLYDAKANGRNRVEIEEFRPEGVTKRLATTI
ncbi:GGDEF domain-containing protein [Aureimonas sp. SA4125]|nr:GGDEF domain-containing protein [Aureimonas sp. SA4125]